MRDMRRISRRTDRLRVGRERVGSALCEGNKWRPTQARTTEEVDQEGVRREIQDWRIQEEVLGVGGGFRRCVQFL